MASSSDIIDASEVDSRAQETNNNGAEAGSHSDSIVAAGGRAASTNDASQKQSFKPKFAALKASDVRGKSSETRSIRVPQHRYTPLRENWESLLRPVVEHLKLQMRFNPKTRSVEMRTSEYTEDIGALQKGEDFVKAFMLGFDVPDAIALLRLDDLYIESFEIHDVKNLKGDHLSRAIGRIAGHQGKTRHAIENATRTRVVVADTKIHILGAYSNIQVARDAICSLILGAPPGKVYNQMRQVSARLQQRY